MLFGTSFDAPWQLPDLGFSTPSEALVLVMVISDRSLYPRNGNIGLLGTILIFLASPKLVSAQSRTCRIACSGGKRSRYGRIPRLISVNSVN